MKLTVTLVSLLAIWTSSFAQKITITQAITIADSNLYYYEQLMYSKGFDFVGKDIRDTNYVWDLTNGERKYSKEKPKADSTFANIFKSVTSFTTFAKGYDPESKKANTWYKFQWYEVFAVFGQPDSSICTELSIQYSSDNDIRDRIKECSGVARYVRSIDLWDSLMTRYEYDQTDTTKKKLLLDFHRESNSKGGTFYISRMLD